MAKATSIIAAIILISLVSTSILAAELEITAETDKGVYSFGEDVIVTVTVRNPTDAPITLYFDTFCNTNYLMDNWFSNEHSCIWVIGHPRVLDPNESYSVTWVHNHWQQYRCPLLPGKHTVAGIVPLYGHGDAIEFEVQGRAPTIYVSTAGNDITGNGSIDNPFATIQRGVNTELLGATVIVRPGTYRGTGNTDVNFEGKGVILRSETGPRDCIIDCNGSYTRHHRAFNFTAGEGRATVIDGFTITNGQADCGGAVYCYNSNPTLANCTFNANSAHSEGGAIYCRNSNPTLENCTFSKNSAEDGGAVSNRESSPTVTNCTFTENSADRDGGGMYCRKSSPTLENCTFSKNSADYGGAVSNGESSPTVTNCTFTGNSGKHCGAILNKYSSPIVTNCTFTGNSARHCGAMLNQYSTPIITNCTFSGNSAIMGCGGMWNLGSNSTVTNCIFYGNTPDEFHNRSDSTMAATYSNIRGGWPGLGNIDTDPCFVSPGYWAHRDDPNILVQPNDPNASWVEGDYHLLPGSPCIDAGDPNYMSRPNDTDLDSNPRIADGNADCMAVVDMGAYEFFIPPIEVPMKLTPRTLNLTSKGKWVKAHLVLPEGFGIEDVDSNLLLRIVEPFELQCDHMNIWLNDNNLVELEAAFDRAQFCRSTRPGEIVGLKVEGSLADCRRFYGMGTIKTLDKTAEYLAGLASYWLEQDCQNPDWCGGFDITGDGVVNFLDFVRIQSCCLEVLGK